MKKFFFALIIDLILTALLQKTYIRNSPITVSFSIAVGKEIDCQVFYTRNAKDDFNTSDAVTRRIKPSEKNIRIELPIAHIYKFRFDPGEQPRSVTIDNIVINSGAKQFAFTDMTKFSSRNLTVHEIKGSRITLTSNHIDPSLWYNGIIDLKRSIQIEWVTLSIVFILSFLISYKLCQNCLIKFNNFKSDTKESLIFCLIFLILLIIPILKMDKREIAIEEKRKLAVFPHFFLPDHKGINFNFGKEFDSWFQDRFNGRINFISQYYKVTSLIKGYVENSKVILYSDNWIFHKELDSFLYRALSSSELNIIKNNLIKLNKFCDCNKIKLYVLICPVNNEIYKSHNFRSRNGYDSNIQLIDYIKETNPEINIIYPLEDCIKLNTQQDLLAYKADSHLTYYGAYILNNALLKEISKFFPKIRKVDIESDCDYYMDNMSKVGENYYWPGCLYDMLTFKDINILSTKYKIFRPKKELGISFTENNQLERIANFPEGKGTVVIIGDSYIATQSFWLQFSFNKLFSFRVNTDEGVGLMRIDRWMEQIQKISPNVLILCANAGSMKSYLQQLYKD